MPEDNNDNPIPERPKPITLEEIERPKPVVEEKEGTSETKEDKGIIERPAPVEAEKEGISETKEESGLIERPKPEVKEYAKDWNKEDNKKD